MLGGGAQPAVRAGLAVSLAVVLGAGLRPAVGRVLYADGALTNLATPDGQSWATAFALVQTALTNAAAGDEVWVAAGTYTGPITLKEGVALYGGFLGGEIALEQRDWTRYVTSLDGKNAKTVVTSPAGATNTTRLDGFVIRNGKGVSGGGINCARSSPVIANNTISENTASSNGNGIYCKESYTASGVW